MDNQKLKQEIRKLYYDWANDPEWIRQEKHGNIELADSFLRIFNDVVDRVYFDENASQNDFYSKLKEAILFNPPKTRGV